MWGSKLNKEIISDKQGISSIVLFVIGAAIMLPKTIISGNDIWLSIVIALMATLLVVLMYSRIVNNIPENNLFDINELLFGKFFGKISTLLYLWFSLHIGILILRDFGDFMLTTTMPETPIYAPIIMMIIVVIWINKKGIEVIGRLSSIYIIFNFIIILGSLILLIPSLELYNIQPILYNGIKPLMRNALSIFSFPLALIVIFPMSFNSFKRKSSHYKVYTFALLMSALTIIITSLFEVLLLGPDLYFDIYYPIDATVSKIKVGDFLQRLEVIQILTITIFGFFTVSLCLLAFSKGIIKLFKLEDYRFIVIPAGLIMCNLSIIIHKNMMEINYWMREIWPFYALLFQLIIPTIMLIVSELKKKRKIKKRN